MEDLGARRRAELLDGPGVFGEGDEVRHPQLQQRVGEVRDLPRRAPVGSGASAIGNGFAEYFEPFTGEPLGSGEQSWTAAIALGLLATDGAVWPSGGPALNRQLECHARPLLPARPALETGGY